MDHDLTKFDLALVGGDLTRPFIAATGGRDVVFVCWIASRMVASECHIMACDATPATIKTDSKYFIG
jgi:hypothetical protein